MTVEQVIDGIVAALQEFDLPVYTEEVEQDLNPPAFFVRSYRNQNEQQINGRFRHTVDCEVCYFPTEGDGNPKQEMNNVSDRLMYLLRIINTDAGKVLANAIEANVSDGTLVVTFNVAITERYVEEVPKMETETTDIKVMLTEHTHFKEK